MLLAVKVKSTQTRGYVADEIGTLCPVNVFALVNSEEAPGDGYFGS